MRRASRLASSPVSSSNKTWEWMFSRGRFGLKKHGTILRLRLGGSQEPIGRSANETAWTTQALLGPLWSEGVPAFSLLWLSEPDNSQHRTGPGANRSLKSIKSSDDNLARVLAALDQKGVRGQTDVIVRL